MLSRSLRFAALAMALQCACTTPPGTQDGGVCSTNADCESNNTREHIGPMACQRWQCDHRMNANVCHLVARDNDEDGDPTSDPACAANAGTDCDDNDPAVYANGRASGPHAESCDGKDNDCNGAIDDNATTRTVQRQSVLSIAGLDRVAIGGTVGTQVSSLVHTPMGESFARFAGTTALPGAQALLFGIATSTTSDDLVMSNCPLGGVDVMGCPVRAGAIDGSETQVVAGVSLSGCTGGVLYVGYFHTGTMANVVLRDFEGLSTVYGGIDPPIGGCGMCTGGGAARPSIATLTPAGGNAPLQALVTYLNASEATYTECTEADVRALGVSVMSVPGSATTHWINGVADGRSTVLGRGIGRASVATYSNRGYFVAYGTTGSISLHFVPAFENAVLLSNDLPDVPTTDASEAACNSPDAGSFSSGHTIAHETVSGGTPVIAAGPPAFPAPNNGSIAGHRGTQVSLAIGAQTASVVDMGLAWVENASSCGTDAGSSVWFSRVSFDDRTGTFTSTPPVAISPMGIAATSPSVAYVDHGVVRRGFTRGGVTADDESGFYVAYVRHAVDSRVVVSRVARFDGGLVAEDPIELTAGAGASPIDPRLYVMGNSNEPINFVYGDLTGAMPNVIGGAIQCTAQ